ncbi:hypothetical protein [Campylobacter concisus]
MIVRNREGLIKALWGYTEFTYGGHVEARLYGETYVITDYNVTILVIKRDRSVLYFDNSFYSKTTSKLQNLLKEVFNFIALRRKAYLFDTTTKKAYLGGVYGEVSFNKDGLILFASIGQIGNKSTRYYSPKSLSPFISLSLGGVWCDIETKLLRGED